MRKLFHFSTYLQQTFGAGLQRIPLDLSLGCPHREAGGFGPGCIFCAEDGARARHLGRTGLDLAAQVAKGREYVLARYRENGPYIAYFQAFTSTFAPVGKLRNLYEAVLREADFRMVIIATRPDALPEDVLDYLSELAGRYELWVELGIQSAHDHTLREIHRGHDFSCVQETCRRLAERGIRMAGHFILGLPGENAEDWLSTADAAAQLPLNAVKMHQLMILKNTELAHRCGANPRYVQPLNEYEYAAGLKAFLRRLPDNWLVMRLMADADPAQLEAPRWWMKKGQFLSFFEDYFQRPDHESASEFIPARTADGSPTLYHPGYRQHFHSLAGAEGEALKKFAEPTHLAERLQTAAANGGTVRLLDIGFGLGGNVMAALKTARAIPGARLEITSLEMDERTLRAARTLYGADCSERKLLDTLLAGGPYVEAGGSVELRLADARQSIRKLRNERFDLIWLDAFSPDANPELWSRQFLKECRRILNPDSGRLVTYSCAPPVRGALFKAGFRLAETPAFGRRRGGTIAALSKLTEFPELCEKERHIILDSTAGTPYSDPDLNATGEWILEHRRRLVERLRRRGVPKWYKQCRKNDHPNA